MKSNERQFPTFKVGKIEFKIKDSNIFFNIVWKEIKDQKKK